MNTSPIPTFGALLRQARRAAGLTQEQLAERAGLSVDLISKVEREVTHAPQLYTLDQLAEALQLEASERAQWERAVRGKRLPGTVTEPDPSARLDRSIPSPVEPAAQQPSRHRLPAASNALVGREQEVQEVCALLRRPDIRLLTLIGPGGIGKTRLALEVAAEMREVFGDGCAFVDLAPLDDPDLVVPTIIYTLGIQDVPGQSLLEILTATLQEQHLLVLLDNFEQVVDAAPHLADMLAACPHITLLVTSREVLHLQAEREYAVPSLAFPDPLLREDGADVARFAAVHLFLQRAQAVQPDFQLTPANAQAVVEICARLDGVPLAIELAAARSKLLSPAALLARLDQRFQLLTSQTRDVPARQRTLRDTIAWSYQLLAPQEQRLFERLAVFVGGCTLDAVEALSAALETETPADFVWEQLAALIDKSLLQGARPGEGEPRYRLLETIRAFGLECLAASGQLEQTQRAHADYYLRLAEEAMPHATGPEQMGRFAWIERERENLRAAFHGLQEHGEANLALRLTNAVARIWVQLGSQSEARDWLERALASTADEVTLARVAGLDLLGDALLNLEGAASAERSWRECLALARTIGDPAAIANGLGRFGLLALSQGNFAAADAFYTEAAPLSREAGESLYFYPAPYLLTNWSSVACLQGKYLSAEARAEEALALFRAQGDKRGTIYALKPLVLALLRQGALAHAASLAEEGLVVGIEVGRLGTMEMAWLLGEVVLQLGDTSRARALAEQSLALAEALKSQIDIPLALALLGKVELAQEQYAAACSSLEQAIALFSSSGVQGELPASLEALAQVATAQQHFRWAAHLWGLAEALRETMGAPLPPIERQRYAQAVAATRARLGKAAFAAAWTEGRSMIPEQALVAGTAAPVRPTEATPTHTSVSPSLPEGLTPREVEVLRLLAQGFTDRQIAEHLVVSPLTVHTHLGSIYGKLGVTSRSAAPRYVLDHHLV